MIGAQQLHRKRQMTTCKRTIREPSVCLRMATLKQTQAKHHFKLNQTKTNLYRTESHFCTEKQLQPKYTHISRKVNTQLQIVGVVVYIVFGCLKFCLKIHNLN